MKIHRALVLVVTLVVCLSGFGCHLRSQYMDDGASAQQQQVVAKAPKSVLPESDRYSQNSAPVQ
jgi:hypothetical protein